MEATETTEATEATEATYATDATEATETTDATEATCSYAKMQRWNVAEQEREDNLVGYSISLSS